MADFQYHMATPTIFVQDRHENQNAICEIFSRTVVNRVKWALSAFHETSIKA